MSKYKYYVLPVNIVIYVCIRVVEADNDIYTGKNGDGT